MTAIKFPDHHERCSTISACSTTSVTSSGLMGSGKTKADETEILVDVNDPGYVFTIMTKEDLTNSMVPLDDFNVGGVVPPDLIDGMEQNFSEEGMFQAVDAGIYMRKERL